ncbi:glutathione peroxidase [Veronia pacifica]|uniref:Glutathione peroxidase n=1 Tax=Veronia pacifica TaxID=1080227 RepID=A0A1C3EMJ8_9GAMM|nr:glutathione peroxidase [Veronia pacifica]ODA34458.1 glutathione peroxidase [Veronia pacifica]
MKDQLLTSTFKIAGKTHSLSDWGEQPILVINTATKCGLAPQFEGLEKIHQQYKEKGLKVIGFPCNQFANQEPETDDSMATACQINFGVSFDLTEKVDVNGADAHPVYQALSSLAPGALGTKSIKWNFTKFLIAPGGKVVKRYSPTTKPENLIKDIEALIR